MHDSALQSYHAIWHRPCKLYRWHVIANSLKICSCGCTYVCRQALVVYVANTSDRWYVQASVAHVRRALRVRACVDSFVDAFVDTFVDTLVDMVVNTCVDTFVNTRL